MAKIPKQLYVVSKEEVYVRKDQLPEPNLGFLNAYEPGNVAFEKKKATQLDWAYCKSQHTIRFIEQFGALYMVGHRTEYAPGSWKATNIPVDEPVAIQPQVWDNAPQTGFKILRSVSRYGTSNKLWRVMDPRGLQFEITTGWFEDIIMKATIQNGEIMSPCVWESNKKLVVV